MKYQQKALQRAREREKEYHEKLRAQADAVSPIDVEAFQSSQLQPCYTATGLYNGDNKKALFDRILRDGGWTGKRVLDYGCAAGPWSVYLALTGARQVVGFDFAESGIRRGCERVAIQQLRDKVKLVVMDAADLGLPENAFDMVVGVGVLHHVMKYPRIFDELHRVMKPGAKAYFTEGLADFPFFKVWWAIKGEVEEGDVPIFAKEVRRRACMFCDVEITGDTFVYALKRFLWKPRPGWPRRSLLRACKGVDTALFAMCPPLRAWGSFSTIVLTK